MTMIDLNQFPGEGAARAAAARADAAKREAAAAELAKTQLAEANKSQLAAVEDAARRAGGVVSGADQNAVDAAVAAVKTGGASAADALAFLGKVFDDNKYKLSPTTVTSGTVVSGTSGGGNEPIALPESTAAADILRSVLERYNLGSLFSDLNRALTADPTIIENEDALFASVRSNPTYIARFSGNQARVKAGLPELTPSEYVEQERAYLSSLRNLGMPRGFYDTREDFSKLIANDVSAAELSDRIQSGYRAVTEADPAVVNNLKRLYRLTDSQLAAYFLDPERSVNTIKREVRAAEIAAAAEQRGRMTLTAATAEELAQRGISQAEAQTGFGSLAELQGLYQEMAGEQVLSEAEKIGAALGYDVQAEQVIQRRKAQRRAVFAEGGGFARTTGATSGTVETGLGGPQ